MSVCTNITQVPNTNYGEDLLQVTIDNDITAFWFYNCADSLKEDTHLCRSHQSVANNQFHPDCISR